MANISANGTPAALIPTARTAAPNAASSTANPNNNPNIIVWSLPNTPITPQVQSSQSFSTIPGQIFSDFNSGQIVTPAGDITNSPLGYALQEGTPHNND
jgi:hypothetical protein